MNCLKEISTESPSECCLRWIVALGGGQWQGWQRDGGLVFFTGSQLNGATCALAVKDISREAVARKLAEKAAEFEEFATRPEILWQPQPRRAA